MNWGKKIMIVFILFAGMIITMVVMSMRQHFDMVTDHYYEEELVFQQQIDAEKNAASFASNIIFKVSEKNIILTMPAIALENFEEGTIVFYRASDANLDVRQELKTNALGVQEFDKGDFVVGRYDIKMSWKAGGKTYYHQAIIHL